MEPNVDKNGVVFGIEANVPVKGGNAAQRREHDKRIGAGTMSRSGAKCPCCGAIMTKDDIRVEGRANRIGAMLTTTVQDGLNGKEYREPTGLEIDTPLGQELEAATAFHRIPHGLPTESITPDAKGSTWCIQYGLNTSVVCGGDTSAPHKGGSRARLCEALFSFVGRSHCCISSVKLR
jgi:hypothetical protein